MPPASSSTTTSLASVFKAYDVRALHPVPLDASVAWRIGLATARFLGGSAPTVVVGRDMRTSSPSLCSALQRGLRAGGARVVDVGMVDTPFVSFAVNHLAAQGGVQTTASHNPSAYNGFKFCSAGARPIGQETGLREIQALAEAIQAPATATDATMSATRTASPGPIDGVAELDLWAPYRAHLCSFMPRALLDGTRRLRVVVDASNGMAGTMIPKVFADIPGLEILAINFDNSTGEFVHEPNPLVLSNLQMTCDGVRHHGADFGVCFDGDADRCMVVDEAGVPIGCDLLTAWLAGHWLRAEPGARILYDLRSTRSLAEAVQQQGGVPIEGRVGHVFMKQVLREQNAPFGGELSGHFYYRDMWCTDSGARALIDVLNALTQEARPISACIAPLRRYAQSGEINFQNARSLEALQAMRAAYPHARFATLDGLSMDCGDWWCNVRRSNTEPLLRLNLEARDDATVQAMVRALTPLLGERVEH